MRPELTKRADYAIRAMLALSRENADGLLSTRRIAEGMAIPGRFLPQVMGDLSRAGLVHAEPGRNGGYRLGRPATQISLLDVIEAVEGDSRRRSCVLRGGPCATSGTCAVHDVFFAAQDALLRMLSTANLAALVAGDGTRSRETARPTDQDGAAQQRQAEHQTRAAD
jgi:Rrf2 family iron-sulfur cluster assembly transcriptional regulator